MTKLVYVSAAALALAAAGCANEEHPHYAYAHTGSYVTDPGASATYSYNTSRDEERVAREESDRLLVEQVRQRLNGYGHIADACANLDITAHDGRVSLAGNVSNDEDRRIIKMLVRSTTGVRDVTDRLEVSAVTPTGSAYTTRTYPADIRGTEISNSSDNMFSLHVKGLTDTDRDLAQRILQGLRTDTTIAAMLPSVNITVSGGRITLSGSVINDRQREVIDSAVERAAGVREVDDRMQIMRQTDDR